ncbi:MAG: hypothetical protein PHI28_02475 [Mangrovibacterium sp.]|nr:hypothetical protein [Mangrovibacterium sp.]
MTAKIKKKRRPETGKRRPENGDRRPENGDRGPEEGRGLNGSMVSWSSFRSRFSQVKAQNSKLTVSSVLI